MASGFWAIVSVTVPEPTVIGLLVNDIHGELLTAVRLRPGDPVARVQLGLVLFARGDLDGAVAHYRRAVEADPELIQARERLARMTTPAAGGAAGAGERTPGTLPVR